MAVPSSACWFLKKKKPPPKPAEDKYVLYGKIGGVAVIFILLLTNIYTLKKYFDLKKKYAEIGNFMPRPAGLSNLDTIQEDLLGAQTQNRLLTQQVAHLQLELERRDALQAFDS
jgi:hypothetical protein